MGSQPQNAELRRLLIAFYSPALKKGGLYRFWVVCHFLCLFVPPSVHHNLVSSQYHTLRTRRIYPNYVPWYWHDLDWDCYMSFFPNLYQSYGPWLTPKFRFRSISWEQIDIIAPNFIYALILTRSSLGSLHIIFPKFVPELWSLIYAKMWFPLNILTLESKLTFIHQILYMHSYLQDLAWDCYEWVMALDLPKNLVCAQYLENQSIEFHQNFNMESYWQDIVWLFFRLSKHNLSF